MSGRILIVSNRLPVTARRAPGGDVVVESSAGGLATGLSGVHQRSNGWWIGWPGATEDLDPSQRLALDESLRQRRLLPVHLSEGEADAFYRGFSNQVLWPLFHYLLDRVRLEAEADFAVYREVNQRMADAVVELYRPGDTIWVHDYQLTLVPAQVRQRLPDARIGFFLHIPFPSSEVFRILPWRREVLEGMVGADLIGFHCFSYVRHFAASVLRVLGTECDIDRLEHEGRTVHLGVHPMSVDSGEFARLGASPDVVEAMEAMRRDEGDRKVILGIDRLDYTKGLLRRLLAVDRLLEIDPSLAGRIRFVQVVVPSRAGVSAYEQLRSAVEESIGRINGRHAKLDWSPVRYLHRPVSRTELVALYRLADVMFVTPLRDGMNLVAKEYVASRIDGDGALVLSEFAGASDELGAAFGVNPYDVDGTARTLQRALALSPDGQRAAMAPMREHVLEHDVHAWAEGFLRALGAEGGDEPLEDAPRLIDPEELARMACSGGSLTLLLDYDGTVVSHSARPEEAVPDAAIVEILARIAGSSSIDLHIVSGRRREELETWLGDIGAVLHAEHGLFTRRPGAAWLQSIDVSTDWLPRVRQILEGLCRSVAGSIVEEKSAGIAWHYRGVEPEVGAARARELRLNLAELTANHPVQVLAGKKLVELRCTGVSKALVVRALGDLPAGSVIAAIGDDRTDEDMFRALPASAITVRVGGRATTARLRLRGVAEVRTFLEAIATSAAEVGEA